MSQGELMLGTLPMTWGTLSAVDLMRLRQAGAGEAELEAVRNAPDGKTRAALVEFFCFICAENYRRLRAVIRLVRWWHDRGHPGRCGADIICNGARSQFRDFGDGGSNDERCLLTRAIYLCCDDLRAVLVMKDHGQANTLLRLNWKPALDTSREALPPLSRTEQTSYLMPL